MIEQLTLKQIKDVIVEDGILDSTDADKFKTKKQIIGWSEKHNIDLSSLMNKYYMVEEIEDELEFNLENDEVEIEEEKTNIFSVKEPKYSSSKWHDFIYTQFEPYELDNTGNPTLPGLRRLVEKYLGEIIFSGVVDLKVAPPDGECGWSCCNYKLDIAWKKDVEFIGVSADSLGYITKTFMGVAEAHKNNLSKPYDKFVAPMAESRAEGRALRKALGLRVMSADEALTDEIPDEMIADNQLSFIKIKCSQLKINPDKLSNKFCNNDLTECTREQAVELISKLSNYQINPKTIEEDLLNEG